MANRYLTTLKDIKGNIIYPQTKANVVLFSTDSGLTVEFKLNELSDRIDSISQGKTTFVGYYDSEEKLKDAYPENITDDESLERKGYYAIIKVEEGNDLLYIWDVGDKQWVKVGTAVSGIQKVNGQAANELGEVIVSGSDINSTANNETKTITEHLQILYNTTEEQEITDTLTLSKEIVIPEVPAVEGVIIDSIEKVGDYGFEEEDGWYQNTNQYVDSSYCYSKITFTVPRDMDIIFDINQDSENCCDYGIFSNLNTDLTQDYSNDGNNVYQSFVNQNGDLSLTYSNVTTGQYYITVKYIKDGGVSSGSDTFNFKLNDNCKGQEYIPGRTYTSEQSITIGDENNLQIEGKDILKEGDVKHSVIELEGTAKNPIVLFDLEVGIYILKGKIKKISSDVGTYEIKTWDATTGQYINSIVQIVVTQKNENQINFLIFNGIYEGYDIDVPNVNINSQTINSRILIDNFGGINTYRIDLNGLVYNYDLDNLRNELNNKVDSIQIIESLDNPTEATGEEYKNKFVNSTNTTDKSIYYGKKVGEEETYTNIEKNVEYNSVYLKKLIINSAEIFNGFSGTINVGGFRFLDENKNILNNIPIYAELVDTNGTVNRIYDAFGRDLYNSSSGWYQLSENNQDDRFDLIQFWKETSGYTDLFYLLNYDSSLTNEIDTITFFETFGVKEIIEQVQLALKEDLENAGGVQTLTSPVRIWDLDDGIYLLPENCSIQYLGATNTSSFSLGSQTKGILKVQSAYNTTAQSTSTKVLNKYFEIDASNNYLIKSKIIGRVVADRGYYNKLFEGNLNSNITSARQYMWFNSNDTMTNNRNYRLIGTHEQYTGSDIRENNNCYINNNELYSNNSKVINADSIQTITGVKTFTEQVGIANTDGTVDYIKHINNNFLVSTSEGTNLLNIDEELNTVSVMSDKVLRASDFVLEGTTLTINLD